MRLWTLHPRYLDAQGLVALWREALLAQKVLQGATKGYRHHPQLERFRATANPQAAIAAYLRVVHEDAQRRGYSFDESKIAVLPFDGLIDATKGQLMYEWKHLLAKLSQRDPGLFMYHRYRKVPATHPLFRLVPGEVAEWERVE